MTIKELIKYVRSDLYRTGRTFPVAVMFMPGFKYMFHWRVNRYLKTKKLLKPLQLLVKLKLILMQYHYGIKIGDKAEIGYGLYIYHFGGIFINNGCILGNNIDIYQDVTIGSTQRRIEGGGKCCPCINNNVVIGAGAKILGPITIESDVAIGANSVVTKDVPCHVAVGGIPAVIISNKGSENLMFCPFPENFN